MQTLHPGNSNFQCPPSPHPQILCLGLNCSGSVLNVTLCKKASFKFEFVVVVSVRLDALLIYVSPGMVGQGGGCCR